MKLSFSPRYFYPLAKWYKDNTSIVVLIPVIKEARFSIFGNKTTAQIPFQPELYKPPLNCGDKIQIDEDIFYISKIEIVPLLTIGGLYYRGFSFGFEVKEKKPDVNISNTVELLPWDKELV